MQRAWRETDAKEGRPTMRRQNNESPDESKRNGKIKRCFRGHFEIKVSASQYSAFVLAGTLKPSTTELELEPRP